MTKLETFKSYDTNIKILGEWSGKKNWSYCEYHN